MAKRASEPAATAPTRPDAFLSYSRQDGQYVESRLAAALEAAGKDVWVDLDDIRGGASDWRATVWAGMEASKAVVFVLSPDSLASRVCGEELAHATALNKRVIPLLHRPIDGIAVPAALERPNWIYGRDSDDFDVTVTTLVTALETDEPWLDMHARLTTRTAEWLRMDRDGSYLLRGRDLRAAERWLDDKGEHAESPTNDQVAYINAGRRASQRRQAMLLGGVVAALGVSIVLGVIAYVQRQTARSQSFAAQAIEAAKRDPEQALRLALDAARLRKGPLVTRALRTSLAASGWMHILRDDKARPVKAVAFSPDGRFAAIGGDDASASVWDLRTGRQIASLVGHRAQINSVEFSPDGRRIATAAADATARIWDLAGHQLRVLPAAEKGDDVWSVAFDRRGRRLITGTTAGTAKVWDLVGRGRPIRLEGAGQDRLVSMRFSPHGRRALTPGTGGRVQIWRISPPARIGLLRPDASAHGPMVVAQFSPDGRRILAAYGASRAGNGTTCVWSLAAGRRRAAACHPQAGSITDATFSPDGSRFVSVSDTGTAVIRAANGRWLATLRRGAPINSVSFSGDGRHFVTTGDDRQARIWSARGRLEHVLAGHTDAVTSARFSRRSDRVLTGSADGSARVWSASQGQITLRGALSDADVAFSPDGRRLLAVDRVGRAVVWDLARPTQRALPLPGGVAPACGRATGCAPWSRDSRYIAGVDAGYTPTVWDARTAKASRLGPASAGAAFMPDKRVLVLGNRGGKIVNPASPCAQTCPAIATGARINGVGFTATGRLLTVTRRRVQLWPGPESIDPRGSGGVQEAAITPDGRHLAAGLSDGLEIYDVVGGSWRAASQPPRDFNALMFDRAGKRILAVSNDRTARIWDVGHLERRPRVLRHSGEVLGGEFSPNENLVLTAGADGRARVWDPADEATLLEIRTSPAGGARFSPDGRTIAVGGVDTVHLLSCEICAPFDQLVRLARARLPER